MNTEFKFAPNQKVITILGDKGFVSTCACDGLGKENKYWVTLQGGKGDWFYESQLTAVDI